MFWEDRLSVIEEIGVVVLTRRALGERKVWNALLTNEHITKVGERDANAETLSANGETPANACINLHSKLCGYNTHITEKIDGKVRVIRWNGIWQIIEKDKKSGIWSSRPRDEEDDDTD